MGPYDPPQVIATEVVAALPERFTRAGSRPGKVSSRYARPQVDVDCYLEGPSFNRHGHLYFTDVPHGRIFCLAPSGEIDLVAEYDGEPNGLKTAASSSPITATASWCSIRQAARSRRSRTCCPPKASRG